MKKVLLPLVLALCLVLVACGNHNTTSQNSDDSNEQTGTNQPDISTEPDHTETPEEPQGPVELGPLTVEVVVTWDDADSLLSRLEDLSVLLDKSLETTGYDAEAITVTVSTTGGTTADALAAGGVDIALLPTEDFITCEDSAAGVLMSAEEPPAYIVAVTGANEELDEAFQTALAAALADETDSESFLSICYPAQTYGSFDSAALQPVRDQVAEESANSGHEG